MKEIFIGLLLMTGSIGGFIAIMYVSAWYDMYRMKKNFEKHKKIVDSIELLLFSKKLKEDGYRVPIFDILMEDVQREVSKNVKKTKENLEWLKDWKDRVDDIETEEAKDYEWLN